MLGQSGGVHVPIDGRGPLPETPEPESHCVADPGPGAEVRPPHFVTFVDNVALGRAHGQGDRGDALRILLSSRMRPVIRPINHVNTWVIFSLQHQFRQFVN